MKAPRKLAVARLWLEVNSFSPIPTGLADFHALEWLRGAADAEGFRNTPTELGAVLDFADAHPDWNVSILRCAAAVPGGAMEDALFEGVAAELLRDLAGQPWDAVYLSLHGALTTERRPSADLDLLRQVRQAIGRTPLGVSFDLHGNMAEEIAALADIAVGYKRYPHTDMGETGAKTLDLLRRSAQKAIAPVGVIVRTGLILHSHNMRTAEGPMQEVAAIAAACETGPVLDVTPFGGFPFADSPYRGASVMAYADGDEAAARHAAETVAKAIVERRGRFEPSLPTAREGLLEALGGEQPVCVLEPSDNIYSGGIADTPGLLASLVELEPKVPVAFAFFHDPDLVAKAHETGIGRILDCRIGGRLTAAFGPPVRIAAKVIRLTDGIFTNRGPMLQGVAVSLGRTALLQVGQISIVVTERRQPVNDAAYLDLHGIDVTRLGLLCAKGKNHIRASLGPLVRRFVEVDTPGPAGLQGLNYRHSPALKG